MFKKISGFTLIEIMIGVFIFAAMSLLFFMAVRSSSKESNFSANTFSAIMIGQKVAEDIMEEYQQNPFAEESLGLNTTLGQNQSIIDGGSVFFMALEDTKPPWGKIESANDGGITDEQEPLYSQMKGFFLSTSAVSEAPEGFAALDDNFKKVTVTIVWQSQSEKGQIDKTFFVFAPRQKKKTADPFESIDLLALGMEDRLKTILPASSDFNKPLPELLNIYIGPQKAAMEIALARELSAGFVESEMIEQMTNEISNSKNKLNFVQDIQKEFDLNQKIGKDCYQLARMSFTMIAAITDLIKPEQFNANANPALLSLSQQEAGEFYYNLKVIYKMFLESMVASRYYYQKLLGGKMASIAGQKMQLSLINRLIDIYRILAFAPEHKNGKAQYSAFLSRLQEMSAWRNQFLYRFINQEQKLLNNFSQLLEKFPNLKSVDLVLKKEMTGLLTVLGNKTGIYYVPNNQDNDFDMD